MMFKHDFGIRGLQLGPRVDQGHISPDRGMSCDGSPCVHRKVLGEQDFGRGDGGDYFNNSPNRFNSALLSSELIEEIIPYFSRVVNRQLNEARELFCRMLSIF